MAGADSVQLWLARDWRWDRFRHVAWAVPVRASVLCLRLGVQLRQLPEMNVAAERRLDRLDVRLVAVAGELAAPHRTQALAKILHKSMGIDGIALAHAMRDQ